MDNLQQLAPSTWLQWVDIALVAFLIYRILLIVRNTRAWRILGGIVFFVLALLVSDWLGLRTLHWILDKATVLGPVALVILLLPEMRQALEGVSKLGLWPTRFGAAEETFSLRVIDDLVASCSEMSAGRIGAIIVLERQGKLDDIASNGVELNAKVSAPLLTSIFFHGNPLHDGAAIVRGGTVIAGACRLPLSESDGIARQFHMRHRAAIGMSEQSDAIVLVVSEERGTMGLASNGSLRVFSNPSDFRQAILGEFGMLKKPTKSNRPKPKGKATSA